MIWRRVVALASLPIVMGAGVVGAQAALASDSGASSTAVPAQTCILGIICIGGGGGSSAPSSGTPSPSFSLPTCLPTALPTSWPTALPTSVVKELKALPQCLVSALPTKLPASLPAVPGLPGVPGLPASVPTLPGLPTTVPGVPGVPEGPGKGTSTKDPKAKSAKSGQGLVAPTAISVITASSATLDDFTYVGNAKLPLAGGGTVTMMKFTASSMTLSGAADAVTEAGHTAITSSPTMAFNGHVVLYATKLSGKLSGVIPLTFTPSTASAVLLTVANLITSHGQITMTQVVTDQATGTADSLTYGPGGTGFSVVLH